MTPDDVQRNVMEIIARRAKAGPVVKALELSAGRAKGALEVRFAVVRATTAGTVADRDAAALEATVDLREASIIATAEFNEAKRLHSDLSDDQMGWAGILKKLLSDGA